MKRHIKLLIENANFDEIEKLKEYCNKNVLDFEYRYGRRWRGGSLLEYLDEGIAPLYYFIIFGNTEDFNKLNEHMDNKLILTDFSEIGNIADLDDSFEEGLSNCIKSMDKSTSMEHKANRDFLDFIMPIKNVETLKAIEKFYSVHMNETQKRCIRDRIDICSGEREKIDEEFTECILSLHNNVKELRTKTGMNRKEFSNYFGIPYRTIEDWENKKSTCANYLFNLMKEKLIKEGKIIYE